MKTSTLLLRTEQGDVGFCVTWDGNQTLEFLVEKLYKYNGIYEDIKEDLDKSNFKYDTIKRVDNRT